MLTKSTNNKMQASAIVVVLFAASTQLQAAEYGREYERAHNQHERVKSESYSARQSFRAHSDVYVNKYSGREREHGGLIAGRDRIREHFIPESHFRSHFGRDHEFHVTREVLMGGHRRIQFGGVYFGITQPWPMGWMPTDAVYIDNTGGAYMLCNRMHPGVRIPVNVEDCQACQAAAVAPPPCNSCSAAPVVPSASAMCTDCGASSANNGLASLSRGQTTAEVASILGAPASMIDLGSKQIYVYQNMKVVFVDGRMSDVL